ncbi:MAG: hypothetical protein IJ250_02805 [Bacteroidales bacterium]|nr:hypothetical protein [Bacteroidales bacterium]
MAKKNLKVLGFIITVLTSVNVFAQDIWKLSTPYEKGRLELANTTLKEIGEVKPEYVFGVAMLTALSSDDEYGEYGQLEALEKSLAVIFVDESVSSNDLTMVRYTKKTELKEVFKRYKAKATALQKKKTAKDIERERLRKNYQPKVASVSRLKQNIKSDMVKWLQKGDFEKTVDYNKRLSGIKEAFDSVCYVNIDNIWKNKLQGRALNYDADKEVINIELYRTSKEGKTTSSLKGEWPYSIATAEYYEREWNRSWKDFDVTWMKGFKATLGITIINGDIYPTKLLSREFSHDEYFKYDYHSYEDYTLTFKAESKNIIIYYNELNIPNSPTTDTALCFNFAEYVDKLQKDNDTIASLLGKIGDRIEKYKYNPDIVDDFGRSLSSYAMKGLVLYNFDKTKTFLNRYIEELTERVPTSPVALSDRDIISLSAPKTGITGNGSVVVEIKVDKKGNVIEACAGARGTTILNTNIWRACEQAAKRSKFSTKADAPEIQVGTITYKFKR